MNSEFQAELVNVTLTWFGWYRLYREVLGTLLDVGRSGEALLLAEEALKVRIDGKHKEMEQGYKKEMQAIVLAITLSFNEYTRSYKHLTDWIRKSIKGSTAGHLTTHTFFFKTQAFRCAILFLNI